MIQAGDDRCKHRWVPITELNPRDAAGMYWFRCKECGRVEACRDERGPDREYKGATEP